MFEFLPTRQAAADGVEATPRHPGGDTLTHWRRHPDIHPVCSLLTMLLLLSGIEIFRDFSVCVCVCVCGGSKKIELSLRCAKTLSV